MSQDECQTTATTTDMAATALLRALAAGALLVLLASPAQADPHASLQRVADAVGEQVRLASSRLALAPLDGAARGRALRDGIDDILRLILQFIRMLWDPTTLGDYAFNIDTDAAKGSLSLTGLSASHLRDMKVDNVDIDVAALCATVDLSFPLLTIRTKYDLDVSLDTGTDDGAGGAFRIFGNDRAKIDLEGIKIHANVSVTTEPSVTISNLRLSIDKDKINIWGLFGGGKISDLISGIASDMVPELVKEFQSELTEFLTNYINDLIKSKLPAGSTTALPTP